MKALLKGLSELIISLAELVVGIMLLIEPEGVTSGIIAGIGVVLMLLGVISAIKYFRTEAEDAAKSQLLVKGLVMLLSGAFCALRSDWFITTFPVLTALYGVVILVIGLFKLEETVDMLRLKREKWYFAALSAVISLVCGALIITKPFATAQMLWTFIGISFIVEAVFDVADVFFGNKEKKQTEEE